MLCLKKSWTLLELEVSSSLNLNLFYDVFHFQLAFLYSFFFVFFFLFASLKIFLTWWFFTEYFGFHHGFLLNKHFFYDFIHLCIVIFYICTLRTDVIFSELYLTCYIKMVNILFVIWTIQLFLICEVGRFKSNSWIGLFLWPCLALWKTLHL